MVKETTVVILLVLSLGAVAAFLAESIEDYADRHDWRDDDSDRV